ncbi:hypothetical protein PI126_g19976 [Phytophthora idaei]|nr:hypothetical protein PI126_g19976 [Phytophthora idaei]
MSVVLMAVESESPEAELKLEADAEPEPETDAASHHDRSLSIDSPRLVPSYSQSGVSGCSSRTSSMQAPAQITVTELVLLSKALPTQSGLLE